MFHYDDGRTVYEIEFYVGNKEYDYEIDAYTGSIVAFDFDIENYGPSASSGSGGSGSTITAAKAKSIALNRAGVSASNAKYWTVEFEYDDGVPVYQVAFTSGTREYDVEINANTGKIIEYDVDSIYD